MTDLRDFLLDQMHTRGMSARQFADFVGVSNTVISRAVSKNRPTNPDILTLNKIAQATGVDVLTLVKLIVPDAVEMSVEARIMANDIVNLPEDERRRAYTFIRGLITEASQKSR